MNAAESKNTKEKILEVASELFARNGFSGTSIRDIAQKADVNLAAINYHFTNKDNLYWKVFDYNYDWMKAGIKSIGEKNISTAELAEEVFYFFLNSDSMMMNTFKIFLSDNISKPDEGLDVEVEERFGPPGQEIFLEKIQNDLGGNLPEAGKLWVTKMIFSQLVHFGVILNTAIMKVKCQEQENLHPDKIAKGIKISVAAHLEYLKNNKELFESF